MDSPRSLPHKNEVHSTRLRFPEIRTLNADHLVVNFKSDMKTFHRWEKFRDFDLTSVPWLGWFFVYAFVQFYYSISRCLALKELVAMYGSDQDYTVTVKLSALSLGFLEDFICTTYFATALWIFDTLKHSTMERFAQSGMTVEILGGIATFAVSWLLFLLMMAPFVADMMLVVYRDMRFSFGLLATLMRERYHLKDAPISSDEVQTAYITAGYLVIIAALFALVRTWSSWADLALWNPTQIIPSPVTKSSGKSSTKKASGSVKYESVALEEGSTDSKLSSSSKGPSSKFTRYNVLRVAVVVMELVVIPVFVVALRSGCSALVAYAALNVTLNELFLHAFEPAPIEVKITALIGNRGRGMTLLLCQGI